MRRRAAVQGRAWGGSELRVCGRPQTATPASGLGAQRRASARVPNAERARERLAHARTHARTHARSQRKSETTSRGCHFLDVRGIEPLTSRIHGAVRNSACKASALPLSYTPFFGKSLGAFRVKSTEYDPLIIWGPMKTGANGALACCRHAAYITCMISGAFDGHIGHNSACTTIHLAKKQRCSR